MEIDYMLILGWEVGTTIEKGRFCSSCRDL